MRKSKNPDTIRCNQWRDNNPEKYQAKLVKDAYNLLVRRGVIVGDKVLYNPNNA